ncbi:thiol-disulfide oxidoreductase DCC family protein [Aliiglaciecola sp. M165]|uniref:thiol-disulfide oxidoreductase DCC family protein n=1 Tax=Aliiglaciecola sp. M165 TaxID=2593649 RepID=UPI00117E0115|nr:DUF393 domain-containing protein [Aliiglaciecola sp. M165]TRY32829.1 DUF393 domain-containing protein [Aliiglaciecola sp. M165]
MKFKIFYDSYCPLCMIEMRKLKSLDVHSTIEFVDIQAPKFSTDYPNLDWQRLNDRIHAQLPDGTMVTGLDATHEVWKQVGKGWVYAPLRWPLVRWFADRVYNVFARHRYRISFWLTGKPRCSSCQPLSEDPSLCTTESLKSQAKKEA